MNDFLFSVVEGWPPDVSLDLKNYILPQIDSSLMKPNLTSAGKSLKVPWKGSFYPPNYILIIVQSAVNATERRKLIRKTWAAKQKKLPIKVIFIVGINSQVDQNLLEEESREFQDLLQENFIDSYNNLTLKSMFMLKYVKNFKKEENVKYVMKVDDDSYINLMRLMDYITIMEKRCHTKCILGKHAIFSL